jgi:hypothetical protein
VSELGNNGAYLELIEDFKNTAKALDNNWQFIDDEKKMKEARITKLAVMSVINAVDNYRLDLKRAEEELVKIDNPEKLVNKDYDTE